MNNETENKHNWSEAGAEQREQKEAQAEVDKELQAAAALERADYLSREVKNNQNQMQNIMRHMQAVVQAIKDLRTALNIIPTDTAHTSVLADEERVKKLKLKIDEYKSELQNLKPQLLQEHIAKLQEQKPGTPVAEIEHEAEQKVKELYQSLELE